MDDHQQDEFVATSETKDDPMILASDPVHGAAARGATKDSIVDIESLLRKVNPATEESDPAEKYVKIILPIFCVSLAASCAAYPIIKQVAPGDYAYLAYALLVVLALVLLFGLLATTFEKPPKSVVFGKYALQLAIGIIIALLTWAMSSLNPEPRYNNVPISVAGALAFVIVAALFQWRKW